MGNIPLAASRARITVAVFYPFTQVGKRRGGSKLALKTGVVAKKQKTEDEVRRDESCGIGGGQLSVYETLSNCCKLL